MKIVIDIPDNIMEYIKNNGCLSVVYWDNEVAKAIIDGTPLPTGEWINANDFSDWLKKQKTGFDYNRCEVLVDRNGIWENALEIYLKERSEEENDKTN